MTRNKITTVAEVIAELQKFEPTAQVLVSSDEELNTLFYGFEIAQLGDSEEPQEQKVVIYGLSGQEQEEDEEDL